jgi:hypothetical protein
MSATPVFSEFAHASAACLWLAITCQLAALVPYAKSALLTWGKANLAVCMSLPQHKCSAHLIICLI